MATASISTPDTPSLGTLPNEIFHLVFQNVFHDLKITVRGATQLISSRHRIYQGHHDGHNPQEDPSTFPTILSIFLTNKTLYTISRQALFEIAVFDIRSWTPADLYKSLSFSGEVRLNFTAHDKHNHNDLIIPTQHFAHLQIRNFTLHPFLTWRNLKHITLTDPLICVSDLSNEVEVRKDLERIRKVQSACRARGVRLEADVTFVSWGFSRIRFCLSNATAAAGHHDVKYHGKGFDEICVSSTAEVVQVESVYKIDFDKFRSCFKSVFDGLELSVPAESKIWDWLLRVPGQ